MLIKMNMQMQHFWSEGKGKN